MYEQRLPTCIIVSGTVNLSRTLPSAERSAAVIPHPVFDDTRREGTDPAVTGTRRPASLRSHQLWVWEGLGQGRHEADSFVFGKHQALGVAEQI